MSGIEKIEKVTEFDLVPKVKERPSISRVSTIEKKETNETIKPFIRPSIAVIEEEKLSERPKFFKYSDESFIMRNKINIKKRNLNKNNIPSVRPAI